MRRKPRQMWRRSTTILKQIKEDDPGIKGDSEARLEQALNEQHSSAGKKCPTEYKGFFQKREDSFRADVPHLDKESFRLDSQREKLKEAHEYQIQLHVGGV